MNKQEAINNYPRISIVTPSFNQGHFLEQTLKSVIDQNYPNLEYIVVDGGSTDKSAQIISKYNNLLAFWCSEPDGGHAHALNKGFSQSTGEIMGWLNSDDMMAPGSLDAIARIFSQFPHVNWIQGYASKWNCNGQLISAKRNPKNIYDYLLGNYAWIQQESVFWRKDLWQKAGSYITSDLSLMVDGELWCRFFLHEKLHIVDCTLGGFRSHASNRSFQNLDKCRTEMKQSIAVMSKHCTHEICKDTSSIKNIAAAFNITRKLLGTNRAFQLAKYCGFDKILLKCGYPLIRWDFKHNQWIEDTLPFVAWAGP